MFTAKGLFSEIPCPHIEECRLPRCLFSHKKPSTPTQTPSTEAIDLENSNHQSGQRKRIKLGDGKQNLSLKRSVSNENTTLSNTSKSLATPTRPISPPPLKRKSQQVTSSIAPSTPKTQKEIVSLASKGVAEKAAVIKKNEVLNPRTLKGPAPAAYDLRLRLARALHEHFQRLNTELKEDAGDAEEELVLSEQQLIGKALDIEEDAARNPLIYTNVVKNKILAYRRMTVKQWVEERQKEVAAEKAKTAAILPTTPLSKPTELPKDINTGINPAEELKLLPRLYTSIVGLSQHGYVSAVPTEQDIEQARKGVDAAQGWEVCDRCKTRFRVFPDRREEDGALASGGRCTYHYGKPFFQERSADNPKEKRPKRYRCCGEELGESLGCTQAENHVFKITEVKRLASILNFMKTPENPKIISANPVCIDGEMGYTVFGLELIRLTATSWPSGEAIFDVLVKPLGGILDLNSRYSGVWVADFAAALPFSSSPKLDNVAAGKEKNLRIVGSPQAARDLLFSHLSPQTPLIGHGLENDLNAARIIHPTIIDTALLYPHKAGLPFRNGLKALMAFHLNRHIQVVVDGNMQGHDSKEDANAAGELVRYKLKHEWEKMRREGWTLTEGVFHPPQSKLNPYTDAKVRSEGKRSRDETTTRAPPSSGSSKVGSTQVKEPSEDGEVNG